MKKSHGSKNPNRKEFAETFGLFTDEEDDSVKHKDDEESQGRQHPNVQKFN